MQMVVLRSKLAVNQTVCQRRLQVPSGLRRLVTSNAGWHGERLERDP